MSIKSIKESISRKIDSINKETIQKNKAIKKNIPNEVLFLSYFQIKNS